MQVKEIDIFKVKDGFLKFEDKVAIEEPLQMYLSYGSGSNRMKKSIAITMRTPGDDAALIKGFLLTEGIINRFDDLIYVKQISQNQVIAELKPDVQFDISSLDRNFYMTSSCGVCGKASIDQIDRHTTFIAKQTFKVGKELIKSLANKLDQDQYAFIQTGGIHAAALFNLSGELMLLSEDVGRHNALDKLIGSLNGKINVDTSI
ncbi:MAG: formate dehydrogenase accessory sulfurtransferase FdhD, partial [Bacteroidota bacterium]